MTAKVLSERVSQNGYWYVKLDTGQWKLKHHTVAEESLGRPIAADERVIFKDRDRTNFNPDNIDVVKKGKTSKNRRIAQIRARIQELQAELEELENAEA
jgi:hypothetical protein